MSNSSSQPSKQSLNQPFRQKPQLALLQSILIGSAAGAIEVFLDHPLFVVKNFMQSTFPEAKKGTLKSPSFGDVAQHFSRDPKLLYQGVLANSASMIPITAIQVGLNQFFTTAFPKEDQHSTMTDLPLKAFSAGAFAAFVASPVERIITMKANISNKKTHLSFMGAGKSIVSQGGIRSLYAGLPMTMARDGIFTAFYLVVASQLKNKIDPDKNHGLISSIAGGVGAGLLATPLSHPFDSIKTKQQERFIPRTFSDALTALKPSSGLLKGMTARGARVISAVTIISVVKEKAETWMNP